MTPYFIIIFQLGGTARTTAIAKQASAGIYQPMVVSY
jgi:hypothetical protein